jgi:hypothetical protein
MLISEARDTAHGENVIFRCRYIPTCGIQDVSVTIFMREFTVIEIEETL